MNHFIWLALCAAGITAGAVLAVKKQITVKTASLCMSGICIVSEVSKMMTHMLPSPLGGLALDPQALPFHLCSMQIFLAFYLTLSRESAFRRKVIGFMVPTALLGGVAAMLIPTDGVDFRDPLAYQCFVFHGGLVWYALYFLLTKQVTLDVTTYLRNMGIMLALAFLMIYVNGALFEYGTNFMFLTRPPMEGLPVLNLNHGWYCYFLTLAGLALGALTLVHLPFLLRKRGQCAGERR